MTVFLTGSTGFVGQQVLRKLVAAGHQVRCLVRTLPKNSRRDQFAEYVTGDVTESVSLKGLLVGCDAIVHLVAIIREKPSEDITFQSVNFMGTQNLVHAARAQSVARFVHMSALGAHPQGITPYFRSKGMAEMEVRSSGLEYTIFRPSFIYGPGDAVYSMLARMIRYSPGGVMPVFGAGLYRHQPVSVFDIAKGVLCALESRSAINRIYDCGGPESLTYLEQLARIGNLFDKRIRAVHVPLWLSRWIVAAMQLLPSSPVDSDRLTMLIQDNVCDPLPFSSELGIALTPFAQGIQYLK